MRRTWPLLDVTSLGRHVQRKETEAGAQIFEARARLHLKFWIRRRSGKLPTALVLLHLDESRRRRQKYVEIENSLKK
jgi:hypothetical protein